MQNLPCGDITLRLAGSQFSIVADRKVFIDVYLVSSFEDDYKAEIQKSTTICCGF